MVGVVRGNRTDLQQKGDRAPRNADDTSDALVGESDHVCVDCDAHQVEPMNTCPSCGGVVVARHDYEESDYDPLIGRKIGKRFTIVARLGAGSMGAVYRARQDGMSREVALKVLKPERAFDAASKSRFEREARATSALTSPHTVTVYDFGEDDSTNQGAILYLAMERLEGEPLGQRLKRVGRIAPAEAVRIAQQALRSLSEAHEKGVVHRDLKPDNIFLHRVPTPHGMEEMVKVLDFGIAKILQPDLKVDSLETQAGTVFGTPRYMSPEQAQSKPLDGRSDLYTIGLILFQMVTGRHVFPDEDAVVVMARHIQSLPPRPREIAPDAGISRKLEAVILKALAKDPKRRPQSALELHEELAAALLDRSADPPNESAVLPVVTASPSFGPVADPSMELDTRNPQHRRTVHTAAYALTFFVVLIGAVGLGVFLAQKRGGPSVVNTPAAPKPETTSTIATTTATTAAAIPTELPAITSTASAEPTIKKPGSKPKPAASTTTAKADVPPTPPPVVTADPPPPPPVPTATAAPTASSTKKSGYGKFD